MCGECVEAFSSHSTMDAENLSCHLWTGMSLQVHLCHMVAGSGVYCLYKGVEKNAKFRKNHSWELVSREIKDIFPSIYQLSETVSPLWTELNNIFVEVGW